MAFLYNVFAGIPNRKVLPELQPTITLIQEKCSAKPGSNRQQLDIVNTQEMDNGVALGVPQGAREQHVPNVAHEDDNENQGAQVINAIRINDRDEDNDQTDLEAPLEDEGAVEEQTTNTREQVTVEDAEEDDEESDSEDEEIERRRNEEKERRSAHLKTPTEDQYGKGKRRTKINTQFYFLQKKFDELTQNDRLDFLREGMKEYKVTGRTHLIERYTTGFMFQQLSVK